MRRKSDSDAYVVSKKRKLSWEEEEFENVCLEFKKAYNLRSRHASNHSQRESALQLGKTTGEPQIIRKANDPDLEVQQFSATILPERTPVARRSLLRTPITEPPRKSLMEMNLTPIFATMKAPRLKALTPQPKSVRMRPKIKAKKTIYLGVYGHGEQYLVRREFENKILTFGPFTDAKAAAACNDEICRKFAKKFDNLCHVLNFPTSKDRDMHNENKFGAIGVQKEADEWFAYRNAPSGKLVKKGPFSTKQEAVKISDSIWRSFERFDPRRLNGISELTNGSKVKREKEKQKLTQDFEEKIAKERKEWALKQQNFEATIEGLEMEVAMDAKPRGTLSDMLKTLHAEKRILQRKVDSIKQESMEQLERVEKQYQKKISALEKDLEGRLQKEKGWDLLS